MPAFFACIQNSTTRKKFKTFLILNNFSPILSLSYAHNTDRVDDSMLCTNCSMFTHCLLFFLITRITIPFGFISFCLCMIPMDRPFLNIKFIAKHDSLSLYPSPKLRLLSHFWLNWRCLCAQFTFGSINTTIRYDYQ